MNNKIKLPSATVDKLNDAGIASRSYARREADTFREIQHLNEKFFTNIKQTIGRRLKGIDYRIIDAGIFRSGQCFGMVTISIYLGHPNKTISLSCRVKESKDIEPMCAEAVVMVKAFNELQVKEDSP